jgi:hypothetical protein
MTAIGSGAQNPLEEVMLRYLCLDEVGLRSCGYGLLVVSDERSR